jgi:CheY-like chemotaxis protein
MLSGFPLADLALGASLIVLAGLLFAVFVLRHGLAGARGRADGLADGLRQAGYELAQLRAALEALPEGVMVFDREGRAVAWNAAFGTLTGTPASMALAGTSLDGLLRAQAEAGEFGLVDVDQEVARQLAQLRPGAARPLLRERPDGRAVEIAASALATGGMVLRCQDVTARRAAEALREEALRLAGERAAPPLPAGAAVAVAPAMPPPATPTPVMPTPAADGPGHARRCRVLLVEDLPVNQIVTATQLRREGHHVDLAASGAEAVQRVAATPYDLVLMDLMMPGMSGFDAARQIRRLPGPAGAVAIHALTATTAEDDRARCLAAGMQGMISKPVPAGVLSRLAQRRSEPAPAIVPAIVPAIPPAVPAPPQRGDVLLDRARLADLRRDLPPATLATLCGQCIDDLEVRLAEMRTAAACGSAADLEAQCHAIAGMAASYGLAAVEKQMRAMMSLARQGDLRSLRSALPAAADAVEQSAIALRAWAAPA